MLSGQVEIVSCSVLITELLGEPAKRFLDELRKYPTFEMIETVSPVYELARSLRERCKQQGVHKLKTPDALHLAAGILSKSDEFWTLDKRLLNAGSVITEVKICLPYIEQATLDLEFEP